LWLKRSLRTSQSHKAQVGALERELELLGRSSCARARRSLEQRVRLAAPLAAVEAEGRAGAEEREEGEVGERLLAPGREQRGQRAG
jgi:hypothetical protein